MQGGAGGYRGYGGELMELGDKGHCSMCGKPVIVVLDRITSEWILMHYEWTGNLSYTPICERAGMVP